MKNEINRPQHTLFYFISSAAVVFIYIVLVWFLSKSFIGWFFLGRGDLNGMQAAIRYDSGNPAHHYLIGKYYQMNLISPDNGKAIEHYREAIRRSPLESSTWIDLSKAYQKNGQASGAEQSLERAVKLSPFDPDLMWEAGSFWLISGETQKAVAALRQYLLLVPKGQNNVYDLCWKLGISNSYLLQNLVPETYEYRSGYVSYLISAGRPAEAQEAWKTIDFQDLDKDLFIKYVNFLIAGGFYDEAWTIWEDVTGRLEGMDRRDETSLVWNEGFEQEVLDGGFGWKIMETAGVRVFIDDSIRMSGDRSLGIIFDGEHNPDITAARQVVIAEPGSKYILRGYVKADSLTTTNGIFLNVLGHNCKGLDKRSEVMTGSSFWKELSVDFEVPADCRAVTIAVRREKSNKFDNKIEGAAWIDSITMKHQAGLLTSSSAAR